MSLYTMMHGTNPLAGGLLAVLGFSPDQFGRIRDCFLVQVDGDPRIAVFTRCGGGNRDDYQSVFDWAREQETYIRDYDDDYDCTYATFEFSVPDSDNGRLFLEQWEVLTKEQRDRAIQSKTFGERSQDVIDRLEASELTSEASE